MSTGSVVVGDFINFRCQIFDQQGNFACVFGTGILSIPKHVFVDSDDNILVPCDGAIQVFKSDGTHLKTIGKGVIGDASGVSMDLTGRIFVTDRKLDTIFVF